MPIRGESMENLEVREEEPIWDVEGSPPTFVEACNNELKAVRGSQFVGVAAQDVCTGELVEINSKGLIQPAGITSPEASDTLEKPGGTPTEKGWTGGEQPKKGLRSVIGFVIASGQVLAAIWALFESAVYFGWLS